jgi:hypothetical protein
MTHAVVDVNANAQRHRARRMADCPPADSQAKAGQPTASASDKPQPRKGDRWATLNTFVDVIAPRLTLAERAVWLVMFRYSRSGVCDTSERAIATQAAIDKASAGRALRRLVELRLVWPVFKSNRKGTSSRYGIHPRPAACLPAAIAADDARRHAAHQRREDRGGDRRGRHRKPK